MRKCAVLSELLTHLLQQAIPASSLIAFGPDTPNKAKNALPFFIYFKLCISVYVLEEDGSLLDCSLLAVMSALLDGFHFLIVVLLFSPSVKFPSLNLFFDPVTSLYHCTSSKEESTATNPSNIIASTTGQAKITFAAFPVSVTFGIALKEDMFVFTEPFIHFVLSTLQAAYSSRSFLRRRRRRPSLHLLFHF